MKLVLLVALLVAALEGCQGANILALSPFPSKSHGIIQERLLRELTAKGHTVTYLTAAGSGKSMDKVKIVEVPNYMKDLLASRGQTSINEMSDLSAWKTMIMRPYTGLYITEKVLNSKGLQQILRSNEKFDLIMGDNFLDESILAGFSHKYQAPLVAIHPFLAHPWANYLVGNPAPSSFIPDPFLAFDTKMTFLQRVENFVYGLVYEFHHINIYLSQQDSLMRKYFGADYPPIHDILKNTSLVLVNHDHTLAYPRPYVPNMIEVGGMHIDEPRPLPVDLQKYMDESKNGVILFSLGSNLKSSDLPPEKLQSILKALARLKQNVLWKFEAEISNMPKNVRVMKWIPQSDVLAHPNLKLFITHGGLLSTTESVERGVPVVGIPFFGDQPLNMKQIENAGFGKTLEYSTISEESFFNTVNEVLSNPMYSDKAKEKSKLFKDTLMRPLDRAIWWIEYVLRHKGAKHLRSAAQDLGRIQLYLLDVYALVLGIILTISVLSICTVKFVFRKICGKSVTKEQKKKKRN